MNVCFIHIATIGNYQHIVNEIFSYLKVSEFDGVFANIAGSGKVDLPQGVIIIGYSDLQQFEFPTLEYIKKYSEVNTNHNICYIHTKGASTGTNICIDEWRQYMLHFNLTNINKITNILKEYDACGVDLVDIPVTHFSGNFWWSTSAHIKRLLMPREIDIVLSDRHRCEFWICSKEGRYTSLHNSNINVYERHLTRYPKEKYETSNN